MVQSVDTEALEISSLESASIWVVNTRSVRDFFQLPCPPIEPLGGLVCKNLKSVDPKQTTCIPSVDNVATLTSVQR